MKLARDTADVVPARAVRPSIAARNQESCIVKSPGRLSKCVVEDHHGRYRE